MGGADWIPGTVSSSEEAGLISGLSLTLIGALICEMEHLQDDEMGLQDDDEITDHEMEHLQPSVQDEEVIFKIQLNCQARKSSELKLLRLPHFPVCVDEIKTAIQVEFSIPACVQTLSYHSIALTGNESLLDACKHIRSHDTLTVDYSCEADVEKIDEIVGWVREVTECLYKENDQPRSLDTLVRKGSRNKYDFILAMEIFDWMDPKAYMNKIYFMDSRGLEAILVMYKFILKQEWVKMSHPCKFLEAFCSHAFANFGETLYLRRVLVEQGALAMAARSLMRVEMQLEEGEEGVIEPMAEETEYSLFMLRKILENSLHTICK